MTKNQERLFKTLRAIEFYEGEIERGSYLDLDVKFLKMHQDEYRKLIKEENK